MKVRELMTTRPNVVTIEASDTVHHAIRLLVRHQIGALPVIEGDRPVGLVAERDVVIGLDEHGANTLDRPVRRIMRHPPPVCSADDGVQDVMRRMTRERARHLLVQEDGKLVGVLSVGDLVKSRLRELETETGVLRDYVAGQRSRA